MHRASGRLFGPDKRRPNDRLVFIRRPAPCVSRASQPHSQGIPRGVVFGICRYFGILGNRPGKQTRRDRWVSVCPLTSFYSNWNFSVLMQMVDILSSYALKFIERPWGPGMSALTPSLPSSKKYISQPSTEKCIGEVVRIASIIIYYLSELWKAKFTILCMLYFGWGCRGNLTLITRSWEWKG